MFTLPLPAEVLSQLWTRLKFVRRDGRQTIAAAASNDFTRLVSFDMPEVERGYLLKMQNEVLDPSSDYGGSLVWRVDVGGMTYDPDGEADFTELRGTRIILGEALNLIAPGRTVTISVRRAIAAANPTLCTASVLLVHWPVEIDRTYSSRK